MHGFETLVPIVAILVAGTAVVLPIAGLTARFALKPLVESYARLRAGPEHDARVELLERRLALMEEQLASLERAQERLSEASEFHRQLRATRS